MRTNRQPIVAFQAASTTKQWDPLLTELRSKGFFGIYSQKLAPGATMGGGTADYYILELGPDAAIHAAGILRGTPKLAGRIFNLRSKGEEPISLPGIIDIGRELVVEKLVSLHSNLGMRDLDDT